MDAPAGRVSIVFTDIQSSTRLWESLGDAFSEVLALHNRVIREALAAHDGYEVKTEGDSFMIAFVSAASALAFALDAQLALQCATWPEAVLAHPAAAPSAEGAFRGPRVRMGVHAGEPIREIEAGRVDYFGPMVNRAARVSGSARGGQVLVSGAAWSEICSANAKLPSGWNVKELGEQRLKGLETPEFLRQVLPAELAARVFEPLDSLTSTPNNLPAQVASFIGRERETNELAALLRGGARLTTLIAQGGTGKTRLSLRVGSEMLDAFEGGVWFVDLSECTTAAGIAAQTARALGISLGGGDSPHVQVGQALAMRKRLLLILDNFEQVVTHAAETAGAWLTAAPNLAVLVTSRFLLGLAGEREYRLEPLRSPSRLPRGRKATRHFTLKISAYDGVRLFVERAREANPGFTLGDDNARDVAEICSELEGFPLAVELAAARIKMLPPAQMVKKLHQKFDLLRSSRRDLSERQQTMLGAIEWSYELLAPWEKVAAQQLSVFRGGFFLDAAEAVLGMSSLPDAPLAMDAVQSLAEKSFLRSAETPYGPRFSMYIPVAELMQSTWQRDGSEAERAALTQRYEKHLLEYGESWTKRVGSAETREALDRLEFERENLLILHDDAMRRGDLETAARAILAAWVVIKHRGPVEDAFSRLRTMSEKLEHQPGELPLWAQRIAVQWASACIDSDLPRDARAFSDRIAPRLSDLQARILMLLDDVVALHLLGQVDEAHRYAIQALDMARTLGRAELIGAALNHFASTTLTLFGDSKAVEAILIDAVDHHRVAGNLLRMNAAQLKLAELKFTHGDGDIEDALAATADVQAMLRQLGMQDTLCMALGQSGVALYNHGRAGEALPLVQEAVRIARDLGQSRRLTIQLLNLGSIYWALHRHDDAAAALDEADRLCQRSGNPWLTLLCRGNRGVLCVERREYAKALPLLEEALSSLSSLQVGAERRAGAEIGFVAQLAFVEWKLGNEKRARELALDARRIAREAIERHEVVPELANKHLAFLDPISGPMAPDSGEPRA